jgi:hypothetical protein
MALYEIMFLDTAADFITDFSTPLCTSLLLLHIILATPATNLIVKCNSALYIFCVVLSTASLNFHSGYSSKRIISAVKRVQFISDTMFYAIPRGQWCDIIVLNVHASVENKTDYFLEELEHLFYQFSKYYMKILLGDLNAEVHR